MTGMTTIIQMIQSTTALMLRYRYIVRQNVYMKSLNLNGDAEMHLCMDML